MLTGTGNGVKRYRSTFSSHIPNTPERVFKYLNFFLNKFHFPQLLCHHEEAKLYPDIVVSQYYSNSFGHFKYYFKNVFGYTRQTF